MTWTKEEIIEQAFSALGLGANQYDISPEDRRLALRDLDTMVAEWETDWTTYPIATDPATADISVDSTIEDKYIPAVYSNLARRLAPHFGKVLNPETLRMAQKGLSKILGDTVTVPERAADNALNLVGAGAKDRDSINRADAT